MHTSSQWPGHSYYETDLGADRARFSPPTGDRHHAVVIIGGGLAGLNTALSLTERGVRDVAICESEQPGHGASGRNGGFVFAGYSLSNQALTRQVGPKAGRELHGWTRQAVDLVRHRIQTHHIDCQFNNAGVLLADWFYDDDALRQFAQAMGQDLGFELDWLDPDATRGCIRSERYGASLHEPGSFHFQPLRYIKGVCELLKSRGVSLYGDCRVESIERSDPVHKGRGWVLNTAQARLSADEVVLTTGGYDTRLWPRIARAIQPIATYIATTPPLGEQLTSLLPQGHAVYDTRFAFDYYRPLPDTRLLWGGRISIQARSPAAIRSVLGRDLRKVFPELEGIEFDHAWGGWMGYTRHQMPLLGRDESGLWHATGFGGHGMAPTTMAGELMAEGLTGDGARLEAFRRWQPVWAGHWAGRLWAQGTYWFLNARDAWRDRHTWGRNRAG